MSASPEIARANGRKGGRPKGKLAKSTLDAQAGKALLIKMYLENIIPINEALLKKAKAGDMAAIKELHDRVYDRARQPVDGKIEGNVTVKLISYGNNATV